MKLKIPINTDFPLMMNGNMSVEPDRIRPFLSDSVYPQIRQIIVLKLH